MVEQARATSTESARHYGGVASCVEVGGQAAAARRHLRPASSAHRTHPVVGSVPVPPRRHRPLAVERRSGQAAPRGPLTAHALRFCYLVSGPLWRPRLSPECCGAALRAPASPALPHTSCHAEGHRLAWAPALTSSMCVGCHLWIASSYYTLLIAPGVVATSFALALRSRLIA